jgi:hypothetical protein
MNDRPLLAQERALLSSVVAFVAHKSTGADREHNGILLRIASICDAIAQIPQVDRFQIKNGPLCYIYMQAEDLIKSHRDEGASQDDRDKGAELMAGHLLLYCEVQSIQAMRALGLPDDVMQPLRQGSQSMTENLIAAPVKS